jgi:hypothetical protein
MSKSLPSHIRGLVAYLSKPDEKANEDLALAYFRAVFGDSFKRQKEAKGADGYVAGSFVLELKGNTSDWLSGLFQGLAYKNCDLDFGQVVVAAKHFIAIWQVSEIPEPIREELAATSGAPNLVGKQFAKRYVLQKANFLRLATWNGASAFGPLFLSQSEIIIPKIKSFEDTLRAGQRIRQRVTINNFIPLLREMRQFFDPDQPIKTVRAFYSMLYAWKDASIVQISQKTADQATIGGELITNLVPGKRTKFKDYVEARFVSAEGTNTYDDFFSRFDQALDSVDKGFRIKHGIYFTDLDLSKLVMWVVKQHIPELGKNYLVIDPACGSGNLVTNWRSPLELRHKVVSEIEPELLFAVEQRMKGDLWHSGKFTVVPKVSENKGLNFLDCSAQEYLETLRVALKERGHNPDKPIAFLCNPPYRTDDDQTTSSIAYRVHKSIIDVTGLDAGSDRYCCFLAQMKLICDAARESGLPGESLLLLFTKSAWLTKRKTFEHIRTRIFGSFEHVAGLLVKAEEFFDVKGSWPVAFTVWRYKGEQAGLDANRAVTLLDLTWLSKAQLSNVPWALPDRMDEACRNIVTSENTRSVTLGIERLNIRQWAGGVMADFKRDRRIDETAAKVVGGLPLHDSRQFNKKAYGESTGQFIGFMDDLVPCRVKRSVVDRPWLNLDARFMAIKKSRCFSGPPTHLGYCASDLESSKRLFFWYALGRTFVQRRYPMWIDADAMWAPSIPADLETHTFQLAFAIAYAENECVETYFPANNPVAGAPELFVRNPMTPVNPDSYWSRVLRPYAQNNASPNVTTLISAVDNLYLEWSKLFDGQVELPISYEADYFIDRQTATMTAGLVQIKDYAVHYNKEGVLEAWRILQTCLKSAKDEFYRLISVDLDYFGRGADRAKDLRIPEKSKFEQALCRRLALAGLLVQHLHDDPNFGRTKLAKLFYLSDAQGRLQLDANYYREAAGPLDQRALYNPRYGIEALANKYGLFSSDSGTKMVRYKLLCDADRIERFATKHLGRKISQVMELASTCRGLSTEQTEIVATLFACWNDFLIKKHSPADEEIITEFVHHWHPKKSRFSRKRLLKALIWMREAAIIPTGYGKVTSTKPVESEIK